MDDELLLAGLGPKKADRLKALGERPGSFDRLAGRFLRAQRKVERRHFRQRRALMYFEKERKKMQRQMGQDPYLDTAGHVTAQSPPQPRLEQRQHDQHGNHQQR